MIEFNTTSEIIKLLAQKVEKVRKKKKITQKELAQKAGVSYGSYRGFVDNHILSLISFISILQVLDLYQELNTLVEINETKTIAQMREEDKVLKKG